MNPWKVEDTDYVLIPVESEHQSWNIRILTGEFTETVIAFGNVSINEDTESLNFNFDLISSPDTGLSVEDVDLQLEVGDILSAVLHEAIENKHNKEAKA